MNYISRMFQAQIIMIATMVLTLTIVAGVFAQELVWVRQFDGPSRGAAVDSADNTIVASNIYNTSSSKREIIVRKLNSAGTESWVQPINEYTDDVFAWSVAVDNNDNILVAGSIGLGTKSGKF